MAFAGICVIVMVCAGAWLLLRPGARGLGWIYCLLALAAAGLQVGRYPHQWQMGPALFGLGLAMVLVLRDGPVRWRWVPVVLVLGCCVVSAGLCWVLPLFELPRPTGEFAVGTRTVHWTDASRDRELVVQFWYPARAQGELARYVRPREIKKKFVYLADVRTNSYQDAPLVDGVGGLPVLVFGHMWGGRRTQDTYLAEELASHGYVVMSLDHPGNAAKVQMADGHVVRSTMFDALSNLDRSTPAAVQVLWAKELQVWTDDNEFALNTLAATNGQAGSWTAGRLDLERVGAFGHSFGGSAAVRLLGMDPRVKSAIDLDGWALGALADRTAAQPVMFLYEARDEGMAGGMPTGTTVDDELERGDQVAVRANLARFGGYRGYVTNTQHADFTDATLLSPLQRLTWTGPIKPGRVREITRGLVLGFFEETLRGRGGVPGFAEVKMERSGRPLLVGTTEARADGGSLRP